MWIIRVSGDVIGVCFRANTQTIAQKLKMTGYVRNMPDRTGEITIDGPRATADRLAQELKNLGFTHIESMEFIKKPGKTGFSSFTIQ